MACALTNILNASVDGVGCGTRLSVGHFVQLNIVHGTLEVRMLILAHGGPILLASELLAFDNVDARGLVTPLTSADPIPNA